MKNMLAAVGLAALVAFGGGCGSSGSGSDAGSGGDTGGGGDVVLADAGLDSEDAGNLPDAGDDLAGDAAAACSEGMRSCGSQEEVLECQGGKWVVVTVCPDTHMCVAGTCAEEASCEPGTVDGCYSLSQVKQCNPQGTAMVPVDCPTDTFCIEGKCEEIDCVPGRSQCVDPETKQICNELGQWDSPVSCDKGLKCVGGKCMSECLWDPKWNSSYIGCEYWSLDLDNYPDPFSPTQPDEAPHGIILGNPGTATATITFKSFASDVTFNLLQTTVEPGDIRVVEFPRMDVDGAVITDRSVRINSNRPVVAYQFNPLDFQAAYSDDSSLLLPAEMVGKEYLILNYVTAPLEAMPMIGMPSQHGYFTILAIEEGETKVSVRVTAKADSPTEAGKFLEPGSYYPFTLQQGQVVNIQCSGKTMSGTLDLSGSHVTADRRIVVFSGHEEAVVQGLDGNDPYTGEPYDCCCAEHLEEQLFPLSSWSNTYLAVKAKPRGPSDLDLWRVQAGTDSVTLTTDPPIPGIDGKVLAKKGDWVQAFTKESFVVTGTGPIQVAQYLSSQGCTDEFIGDPSLIMAVSQERFRTPYALAVPKDYVQDWISVVRPIGAKVVLDGTPVSDAEFDLVGQSGYERAYFKVEDGPHYIEGDEPFGIYQYGFDGPASYGHMGGMNLVKEN